MGIKNIVWYCAEKGKGMEKIIGIAGYECEDIGLYLAKILAGLGQKVVLVDRTEQEMLLEMLEVPRRNDELSRETEVSGILVTNQNVCPNEFDRIIYLFGYHLLHPKLYQSEILLMITDGIPAHAVLLGTIDSIDGRKFLILRNQIPMKHTGKYLAIQAECKGAYCEIPYDEKDIRMRGSLSALNFGKLKKLSLGMKSALLQAMFFICPESGEQEIKKLIQNDRG